MYLSLNNTGLHRQIIFAVLSLLHTQNIFHLEYKEIKTGTGMHPGKSDVNGNSRDKVPKKQIKKLKFWAAGCWTCMCCHHHDPRLIYHIINGKNDTLPEASLSPWMHQWGEFSKQAMFAMIMQFWQKARQLHVHYDGLPISGKWAETNGCL